MTNKFITILLTILTLGITSSCADKEALNSISISQLEKIDSVLNHYIDEDYFPFVYARIEDIDGKLIYEHSSTNKDLLPNTDINGDSWIRIWSMSKIVTISIALDLVEEGIIKLSDPVYKFIPEFKDLKVAVSPEGKSLGSYAWGERSETCPFKLVDTDSIMTVLHLINHEAGFYYANGGFSCLDSLMAESNFPKANNSEELISKMAQLLLIQHPGESYYYGTNTTVLGLVAERATQKSLKQLVEERISTPMKIEGLQYSKPEHVQLLPKFTGRDSILRQAEKGELDIFGPDVPDYDANHELYLGGEGMLGTADGYADFLRMLLKRGELNGYRFLEPETVKNIHSPHTQKDSPYGYNGYNLWVSGDSMRIHNYGDAGLWLGGGYESTSFWADPKRNIVGIVMSQNNAVQAPGYMLSDEFRGAVYNQIFEAEKQ